MTLMARGRTWTHPNVPVHAALQWRSCACSSKHGLRLGCAAAACCGSQPRSTTSSAGTPGLGLERVSCLTACLTPRGALAGGRPGEPAGPQHMDWHQPPPPSPGRGRGQEPDIRAAGADADGQYQGAPRGAAYHSFCPDLSWSFCAFALHCAIITSGCLLLFQSLPP